MQALPARLLISFVLIFLSTASFAKGTAGSSAVLIRCQNLSCAQIAQEITKGGGIVTYQYQNINALSAKLNPAVVQKLTTLLGPQAISKDVLLRVPPPKDQHIKSVPRGALRPIRQQDIKRITGARSKDYIFNNALNGALAVHQKGVLGEDVIVAIIDTGTANNPEVVPALANTVIGGENFVEGDEEPSATSTLNDEHGTWVASLVAAHTMVVLPENDEFIQSLLIHAPDSLVPLDNGEYGIPMLGMAPLAKVYAMKTFAAGDHDGGSPQSRILAAMDRAITLKTNYNQGKPSIPVSGSGTEEDPFVYDSLNIQVVNMSLGGPTLNPGYDLEDRLTLAMNRAGIVVVTSAGNEGPGAITVPSPATGYGSIAVGAGSNAINERILRDLQFGLGTGLEFRPHKDIQLAYFSSRGPNADGRRGPDIVANGYATFVQGPMGDLAFLSGTSFSAPTVAGAAALLWSEQNDASPRMIKNSLLNTANPRFLTGRLSVFDQGRGFLDMKKALNYLRDSDNDDDADEEDNSREAIRLGSQPEPRPILPVLKEVVKIHSLRDEYEGEVELQPGEITQLFFNLPKNIANVDFKVISVKPELPPEKQNPIFGDDLLVSLLDAPTSINHVLMEDFVFEPSEYSFADPQPGIMRLAVVGDWTNVGKVKAKFRLSAKRGKSRELPLRGRIEDEESDIYSMVVDEGTQLLDMELRWRGNWTVNPSFDIDVILVSPSGEPFFDGATLHSPERIIIPQPEAGEWTVIVDGYELHGFSDVYKLGAFNGQGKEIPITP